MFLQALRTTARYSGGMRHTLTPSTAVLLVIAPLLWAGNAVVGRLVHELIPPITLNFIRWVLAFAILLPLAHGVLRADSPLWPHWRRYALLGLLGIGAYNALQYMALQTSTPINVTLVGSSMPVWMLAVLWMPWRVGAAGAAAARGPKPWHDAHLLFANPFRRHP